jgi:chitinase
MHVLTGFWHNCALRLSDVPASYNIIAVSFAEVDASKPGGVTFTFDSGLSSQLGGYTDALFKADIKTLQGRGQQVIISAGGQNGGSASATRRLRGPG